MYLKNCFPFLLILFLFIDCLQGENIANANDTLLIPVTAATTTSSDTSTLTESCPIGYINYPKCGECDLNYERKEDRCFLIKSELRPSNNTSRRVLIIVLGCLLTVFIILSMLVVYGRSVQQRRRRSSSNTGNITNPPNTGNRFNNILQSIGLGNLNTRGRFNFFSAPNNNQSSGQHRQPDTSRSYLSENPDEALLFDDPYIDGGLHNPSVNPYKTLTLSVT